MKKITQYHNRTKWRKAKKALSENDVPYECGVHDEVSEAMAKSKTKVVWTTNMADTVYWISINSADQNKAIEILTRI